MRELTREEIAKGLYAEAMKLLEAAKLLSTNGTIANRINGVVIPLWADQKPKGLTPEGRARIAAAQRRRWAKQKRGKKTAKPTGGQ